jgi:hypothetical protein
MPYEIALAILQFSIERSEALKIKKFVEDYAEKQLFFF